jgi:hypothetical protein
MICRQIRGSSVIEPKIEPLTIYSTQAKGYRIQIQNELQYELQCWEGRSPDQRAACVGHCRQRHPPEMFGAPIRKICFCFRNPSKQDVGSEDDGAECWRTSPERHDYCFGGVNVRLICRGLAGGAMASNIRFRFRYRFFCRGILLR